MRRAWGFLAAACAAAAVLVAFTGATNAQTAVEVTADPTTDLVDGSQVTVSFSGVPTATTVQVTQCLADATSVWNGCTESAYVMVDESGAATHVEKVDAVIRTAGGEGPVMTDCREEAEACVIGVSVGQTSALTHTIPLTFTADGALALPPVAEVAPAENLTDLQEVTVTGTGFVWTSYVALLQCPTGFDSINSCTRLGDDAPSVDLATNSFEATVRALAVIDSDDGSGGTVDCLEPDACVLTVMSGSPYDEATTFAPEKAAVVPLHFDPDGDVQLPTMTATPDSNLRDGDTVRLKGAGLIGDFAVVSQCASPVSPDTCLRRGFVSPGGADGGFETTVTVVAGFETAAGEVDCQTSAEPCKLVVSRGSLTSVRAASVDLHFDPDAEPLPPPTITLDPASELPDEGPVTLTGSNFSPDLGTGVSVCAVGGDYETCDSAVEAYVQVGADGTFSTVVTVAATYVSWGDDEVDCRAEPGCEVVVRDHDRGRTARATLQFGPEPAPGTERYVDPVFDEVEVIEDVVFSETTDHAGRPVQLLMDIYQPAGDDAAKRPAIAWMHGDWFNYGDKGDVASYARAYAERGWVAVSMEYRLRTDFQCCSTTDVAGLTDALLDSYEDGVAGVEWLKAHGAEYRIDPNAIVAAGADAGGAISWNLADLPGQMGIDGVSHVAGSVSIGGANLGTPDSGEPPVIAFHGKDYNVSPAHMSQSACARATALGTACQTVEFDSSGWSIETSQRRAILRDSVEFLANNVLAVRGYVDRPVPPTTPPPATPTPTPTPTPTATPAAGAPVCSASTPQGGTLPRTGTDTTVLLIRVGLILLAAGVVILTLARQKGKKAEIAIFAVMALTVAAVTGAFFVSSEDDDPTEFANRSSQDKDEDHTDHSEHADRDDRDRDDDDHDSGATHDEEMDDEEGAGHDDGTGTGHDDSTGQDDTTGTGHDDGHSDDGHSDGSDNNNTGSGNGSGHDNSDSHHDGENTNNPNPPHDSGGDPNHPHNDCTGGDPNHPHDPGGDPNHPHDPQAPNHPHDPDPPVDEPGFPADWTAEEIAKGTKLIDDTEAALVPYHNPGLLPLLGYQWIFDGNEPETYQHWISIGRIIDPHPPLYPALPESLVFRNDTEDGPKLEAAMYMLGLWAWNPGGDPLAKVPEELRYLPDWHIHDNLCFEDNYVLVGVTKLIDGEWKCESPTAVVIPTPPMLHVWIVPTPCGRFAGVDETGLRCDGHHHDP